MKEIPYNVSPERSDFVFFPDVDGLQLWWMVMLRIKHGLGCDSRDCFLREGLEDVRKCISSSLRCRCLQGGQLCDQIQQCLGLNVIRMYNSFKTVVSLLIETKVVLLYLCN